MAFTVFCTAMFGTAIPALAQGEDEIATLAVRRDEIRVELAELDVKLTEAAINLEQLAAENEVAQIQLELIADEFERAVHARREPGRTRVEIAIAGFTTGDPRHTALIDEVMALQGNDDKSRTRQLYTAVLNDAQARLAEAEDRLRDVTGQLADAKGALDNAKERANAAEVAYNELAQRRAARAVELEETVARIGLLRSLQTKALLTGLRVLKEPVRPALIIKIDNVRAARPQAGINAADIVYVEEIEGGLTRLAAVFHSTTPAEVGPVRSMRTGDFDLLGQYNSPLFANSGGNRITTKLLRSSTLVDIGAASHYSLYYRTGRAAPHNLFTNPANIWSIGSGADYATGLPPSIFGFRDADAAIQGDASGASGISLNYGQTRVNYGWNGKGWARSQDDKPTVDTSGSRVAPTTVVIQFTNYVPSPADRRSPEAVSVGHGEVWILTAGQVIKGNWRRATPTDPIEYVDSSGNVIAILPGRTWVEMPRPGRAVLR